MGQKQAKPFTEKRAVHALVEATLYDCLTKGAELNAPRRVKDESKPPTDVKDIATAVIAACMHFLLQDNPSLCVPDFIFPAADIVTKSDLIPWGDDNKMYRDVMAVKDGKHTIMLLRFRVPDTTVPNTAAFDVPFAWSIVYAGDDGRSFRMARDATLHVEQS